ncbi:MAG TPA: hypothetical protein VFU31_27830 [Candidatus Binatia bacterium]|nr:hypothetical protein [Candidatus Binatia bacterium]
MAAIMAEGYKLVHKLVCICEECGADSSVPHMVKHFATCSKSETNQAAEIARLRNTVKKLMWIAERYGRFLQANKKYDNPSVLDGHDNWLNLNEVVKEAARALGQDGG